MALMMASSVAWMVAVNSGLIKSLGSMSSLTRSALTGAPGLAVEKAMKMSPEPLLPMPPVLAIPSEARSAIRLS